MGHYESTRPRTKRTLDGWRFGLVVGVRRTPSRLRSATGPPTGTGSATPTLSSVPAELVSRLRSELRTALGERDEALRSLHELRLELAEAVATQTVGDSDSADASQGGVNAQEAVEPGPSAEAILEERRAQLVSESDALCAAFAKAAATRGVGGLRENREWRAQSVRRSQEIQTELREINAKLKIERMARQNATYEEAQRRKRLSKTS